MTPKRAPSPLSCQPQTAPLPTLVPSTFIYKNISFIRTQKAIKKHWECPQHVRLQSKGLAPHSPSHYFNRTWLFLCWISISLLFRPRQRRWLFTTGTSQKTHAALQWEASTESLCLKILWNPQKSSRLCFCQSCIVMSWLLSNPKFLLWKTTLNQTCNSQSSDLAPATPLLRCCQYLGFTRRSAVNSTLSYSQAVGMVWGQLWTGERAACQRPGSHFERPLSHFPCLPQGPLQHQETCGRWWCPYQEKGIQKEEQVW